MQESFHNPSYQLKPKSQIWEGTFREKLKNFEKTVKKLKIHIFKES